MLNNAKIKNAFLSKVKGLVVAYDEKKAQTVELKSGVLTIYVRNETEKDAPFGWVGLAMRPLIPAYNAYLTEHE